MRWIGLELRRMGVHREGEREVVRVDGGGGVLSSCVGEVG